MVRALDAVDLDIQDGERVALVGRSGSGKTTLLNILAGLDRPTSGSLSVGGDRIETLNSRELAAYRNERIGVVFQSFQLLANRSALQNVEVPLLLAGLTRRERRSRALQAIDRVGLSHRARHLPAEMSGGEQQRVAVARAIVRRPQLVLADEPTGNLDTGNAQRVMELILEVTRENSAALILITHDRGLAREAATRVHELRDGRMVPDPQVDQAIQNSLSDRQAKIREGNRIEGDT